jgi:hypothetical protein
MITAFLYDSIRFCCRNSWTFRQSAFAFPEINANTHFELNVDLDSAKALDYGSVVLTYFCSSSEVLWNHEFHYIAGYISRLGTSAGKAHRLSMWRWSFFGVRELLDIFKTLCFPAMKRGLILKKKKKKKKKKLKLHFSDLVQCQKAIGDIYFTKKWWRAETLQPGLEFDNFKPRLESCIFNCISCLNGFFF